MCVRYVSVMNAFFLEARTEENRAGFPFVLTAGLGSKEGDDFHMMFAIWVLSSILFRK